MTRVSQTDAAYAVDATDPRDAVRRRIRLFIAARAAFLHDLWTQEEAEENPLSRLVKPGDRSDAEPAFFARDAAAADLLREASGLGEVLADPNQSRFGQLVARFDLSAPEATLIQLLFAAETDPSLGAAIQHVSPTGGHAWVTRALSLRLCGDAAGDSAAPCHRWGLIERRPTGAGLPEIWTLAEDILDWLQGATGLPPGLRDIAELRAPPGSASETAPDWPVTDTANAIKRLVEAGSTPCVTLELEGGQGDGRRSFAASVAATLDLRLMVLPVDRLTGDTADTARCLHRWAWLSGTAPLMVPGTQSLPVLPADLRPFPIAFRLSGFEAVPPPTLRLRLPAPVTTTRRALWRRICPSSADWPEGDLDRLAARHRARPGAIAAAAATAPENAAAASDALRAYHRDRFHGLAQRIDTRLSRDDLVLPYRLAGHLDALIAEAGLRNRFWERDAVRRLFPLDRGLVALLTGPPGTGKTMAAQVIAAELNLDLYRVDVSALVSKWIGETMKNIRHILDVAESAEVVLLFDEADGFFARRTDLSTSNDRHANQDTGQLLQAIEAFPGIAILTSNRKRNIDEAFTRRLRHIMEFPLPDETARLRIWRNTVSALFGADAATALDPALNKIAARIDLTGAHIKHAALTAAFRAETDSASTGIKVSHLLYGIDAELMKDGRALTERDRDGLEDAA